MDIIINLFERVPATLVATDKKTGLPRPDVVLSSQEWILDDTTVVSIQPHPTDPNTVYFAPLKVGAVKISAKAAVSFQ